MKKLFTFITIMLLTFSLIGCSGNDDNGNGGGSGGGSEGHVNPDHEILDLSEDQLKNLDAKVIFWHAMGQENMAVIDQLITEFNKTYPNIKVEHSNQGGYTELRDKVQKTLSGGANPTIAQTYPDHVALYIRAGAARKLDDFESSKYGLTTAEINDFIPEYYAEGRTYDVEKTLYSLPFNKSTEVLFINASWFDARGLLSRYNLGKIDNVEYPDGTKVRQFVPNDGAHLTWDDIVEICEIYVSEPDYTNKNPDEKDALAAFSADSLANLFITLTQQWGGEYTGFDEDGNGQFLFNNRNSKASMEWYLKNYDAGHFGIAKRFQTGTDYSSDAFKAQKCVMTIGSSAGAKYNKPDDNAFLVGALPYPQFETGTKVNIAKENEAENLVDTKQCVIQQGTNLSLFKCNTAEEELAGWLFMKFICANTNAQYIWSTGTGYFPSLQSVWDSEEFYNYLEGITLDGSGNKVYSEPSIGAKVAKIGYAQKEIFFTNVSFHGTSEARDLAEEVVDAILTSGTDIDLAYQDALDALKKYQK